MPDTAGISPRTYPWLDASRLNDPSHYSVPVGAIVDWLRWPEGVTWTKKDDGAWWWRDPAGEGKCRVQYQLDDLWHDKQAELRRRGVRGDADA